MTDNVPEIPAMSYSALRRRKDGRDARVISDLPTSVWMQPYDVRLYGPISRLTMRSVYSSADDFTPKMVPHHSVARRAGRRVRKKGVGIANTSEEVKASTAKTAMQEPYTHGWNGLARRRLGRQRGLIDCGLACRFRSRLLLHPPGDSIFSFSHLTRSNWSNGS
jgi:hypothetical protein